MTKNIKIKVVSHFLHLEHTKSLDLRIQEKSQNLQKYLSGVSTINWHCRVEKNVHYAEVEIIGPRFYHSANASSDSLYKTIDSVIRKLKKQLSKRKEKVKSRRLKIVKNPTILDVEQAWGDYDENYFKDVA